jgi:hypothetical protein
MAPSTRGGQTNYEGVNWPEPSLRHARTRRGRREAALNRRARPRGLFGWVGIAGLERRLGCVTPSTSVTSPQRGTFTVQDHPHPGRLLPIPVRRPVDRRRHPHTGWHVPRNGETLRSGRARRLWLLCLPLSVLLGPQALPGLHRRWHAGHVWCLANPKIGEREVLAALLEHDHHLIRDGQILLPDKGFSGQDFKNLTEATGLDLRRPDRRNETYRDGNLGGVRQWIESVNQTLKGQLDLEQHG